ncbi:hypothetical protein [Novosphingobium cyanobacteriorum]|uniref:Uncharacterized protein n=1 Tax=Novosphingobium cyanobacteriorum TaxID=3024215 RepID=A0ABT6CKE2_9SPHN|nr:hypothetical protein [Novosphingobium cyanobacteriorum]MDF8334393.1 hypothetical protein [Novosphingobium cyanobacteriorum]
MKYAALALAAAISALAVPAVAQDAAPAAAPAPAATVAHMLPASTLVSITPDKEISSKKIEVGQKVSFSVVNDITDNGAVVIPRGSHVEGTISFKTGKAIGGKSGKFEVNFDKVNVRGKDYAMRGTHRQEGKGNTVAAVFATWLVSGRSAVMLPGQFVDAFTAEPIPY